MCITTLCMAGERGEQMRYYIEGFVIGVIFIAAIKVIATLL